MSSTEVMSETENRGAFFCYSDMSGKKVLCQKLLLRILMQVSRALGCVMPTTLFRKTCFCQNHRIIQQFGLEGALKVI